MHGSQPGQIKNVLESNKMERRKANLEDQTDYILATRTPLLSRLGFIEAVLADDTAYPFVTVVGALRGSSKFRPVEPW